jgi:hypothetical protein
LLRHFVLIFGKEGGVMKYQPTSVSKRKEPVPMVLFSLLFFLFMFVAANVQAKKPPKPPPEPQIVSENLVRWGGDEPTPGVLEADYRYCSLVEYADDMSSGTYECNLNSLVFYDFANFICEVAHRRGDDWRCSSKGSQYYIEPDLEYSYSWNGDCTSVDGCEITVVNRFTDIAVLGGPVTRVRIDPALDRLTLEGFGRVSNSISANPFDVAQSITIDYMHITFIGVKGKGKELAVCRAIPLHENFPVTFETIVIEDT